jgi:asparagine synthase (glutamine-hydrolysing)
MNTRLSRARRVATALPLDPAERYFAYTSYLDGLVREDLYTPELWAQVGESRAAGFVTRPWADSSADHPLERMLEVDVRHYLPGDLLVKMDVATMAHSLEARSPLLDHHFMQFAASLPPEQKVDGARTKVALRGAMRGVLPDEVLDGPKQGFEVPVAQWLRGDLRGLLEDVLLGPELRERGYFQEPQVRRLVRDHVDGRRDNSRGLWHLLVFELWHQRVADRPAAARGAAIPAA